MNNKNQNGKGDDTAKRTNRKNWDKGWDAYNKGNNRKQELNKQRKEGMKNRNSGDCNSGYRNSGYRNSGYRNSGYRNSGDCNSGYWNSGDCNSGDWNSGNWNSGDCNSGYWNSGDRNSGDWNSGDCNSGNWNSGDCNSGYLNSDEPTVRVFNKDSGLLRSEIELPDFFSFGLTIWIKSREMTAKEQKDNKFHAVTGGFLKTRDYKEAFVASWKKATEDDKKKLFALPNFDAKIFKEISGIDVNEKKPEFTDDLPKDSVTMGDEVVNLRILAQNLYQELMGTPDSKWSLYTQRMKDAGMMQ